MTPAPEIITNLAQFHGTEQYHGYRLFGAPPLKLTDGVFYLVNAAQCCWLLDIIGSVFKKLRALDHFHSITLTRKGRGAVFIAEGADPETGEARVDYRQEIEFTDFPLPEIKLFFQDDVVMLPGEY